MPCFCENKLAKNTNEAHAFPEVIQEFTYLKSVEKCSCRSVKLNVIHISSGQPNRHNLPTLHKGRN
jgi:hypothetical protein